MAFTTGYLEDPQAVGGGESTGHGLTITATSFENGLYVGRFAKLDTGRIDNLDASVTPVIAGVVLRNITAPLEAGGTVDSSITNQIEFRRQGLVTVEVKAGETPAQFGAVSVYNVADADAGKALATGGVATKAEFIREVRSGVWLINLNLGV